MPDYGQRVGGAGKKGSGWLGPLKRPDGGVSTEITMQFDDVLGGNPVPLLVPTLTPEEIAILLSDGKPTNAIIRKAIDHAYMRDKQGLSPFKD